MTSTDIDRVSFSLLMVRFARGVLMLALGYVYLSLIDIYQEYHWIGDGPFFDAKPGLLVPPGFTSILICFCTIVNSLGAKRGIRYTTGINYFLLFISINLEFNIFTAFQFIYVPVTEINAIFLFFSGIQFLIFFLSVFMETHLIRKSIRS